MIDGELVRSVDQEKNKLLHKKTDRNQCHEENTELPLTFHHPNLSDPVYQGRCGSCWANSTISMLQDRATSKFQPSIQDALGTSMYDSSLNGCSGGDPFTLLQNISGDRGLFNISGDKQWFISDNICLISNEKIHECGIEHLNNKREDYLKCINTQDNTDRIQERTKQMKLEVYNKGPIVCLINALSCNGGNEDNDKSKSPLKNYKKGEVITSDNCAVTPNHAVEIVGWEQDCHDQTETNWIIKNSWGVHYGDNGYFKVRAGKNVLGIENECSAANVEQLTL
jgi:hypothetical protein